MNKVKKIRKLLKANDLAAYIIPSADPHQSEYVADHWASRAWLTGFTGSAGTAVITQKTAGLWTDSRYFIQAEEELKDSDFELFKLKIPHTAQHIQWILENLIENETVGIDGNLFSVAQVRALEKKLKSKKIKLKTEVDFISEVWKNRPELPKNKLFIHALKFAGKSRIEKINEIRAEMKSKNADFHLVSSLDDIAWILNIRGSDVKCNPVVIAHLLMGLDEIILFINAEKINKTDLKILKKDGITIKSYSSIEKKVSKIPKKSKLLFSPHKINYQLYNVLPKSCKKIEQINISTPLKAIKNKTEIRHIRNAMIQDGVALLRLFKWLEENLGKTKITEFTLGEKLKEFRAKNRNYLGESFDAIVGYLQNGAIVHYKAKADSAMEIKKKGILLLDSGGQYLNGTTDITRTIALGRTTKNQRENFTRVLKGNIALATIQFPENTRGFHLEVLARKALWDVGLNYGHGTGHGVGFCLNVHEGPQQIGRSVSTTYQEGLKPGMLTSNEPGIYIENEYGIRIENLILCKKTKKTKFGQFYGFETVSLFPIDKNLIEKELLNQDEINWLNKYQALVYKKLAPKINASEKIWLAGKTEKI